MNIVGIDLSGPAGTHNTGIATFTANGDSLHFADADCDGSDVSVLHMVEAFARNGPVVVGIDAPLSYQPGGGDRPRDRDLRQRIVARGMHSGSVMAPTAPRMVYLTLRGVALAQVMSGIRCNHVVQIVEVHPGASLCFRDAPLHAVRAFASEEAARATLLKWLAEQRVRELNPPPNCTSHFVAACAAAIAAADWAAGKPRWVAPAEPPWHPYDFAA